MPAQFHNYRRVSQFRCWRRLPARNTVALMFCAAPDRDNWPSHVNTTMCWVTYARRDWVDYLAIRAAEQKTSHDQ